MQAVECGETSFSSWPTLLPKPTAHNPVNLSPIVPPSVTGSFTPDSALRRFPASAREVKPVAWFRQAVHRFAALCYPAPSQAWDRATDGPKNFRFPVFLRSLGWLVCSAAFAVEGLPVFQATWIARWACAHRASQLVFRRSSVV